MLRKRKHYQVTPTFKRKKTNNYNNIITNLYNRDFTLPGYRYLGPGNKLDKGEPTGQSDAAAQKHDYEYTALQQKGINPYTTYNYADETFINEVGNDIGGQIGKRVFQAKRIAANAGLLNKHTKQPKDPHKYWQQREKSQWYHNKQKRESMYNYGRTGKHPDKTTAEEKASEAATDFPDTEPATNLNYDKKDNINDANASLERFKNNKRDLETLLSNTSNDMKKRKIKEQISIQEKYIEQATQRVNNVNNTNNTSLSNSQGNDNMASNNNKTTPTEPIEPETSQLRSGSTANPAKHGGETQLANINYTIYRPYPSTNQVLMPFYKTGTASVVASGGYNYIGFRLNSIFDTVFTPSQPTNDGTTDGGNAAAVDAADGAGSREHPFMRDFWKNIYNYYAVVQCNYKITFIMDSKVDRGELTIYEYKHGQQGPPLLNSAGAVLAHRYRQRHPGCNYQFLQALPVQTTSGVYPNTLNNKVVFRGTWTPGSIKHEVVEDELRETWTKMNTTPTDHEKLTYLMQKSQQSNTASDLNITYHAELEYIVQLKDLKLYYEYIDDAFDTNAVTNAFAQTTD